MAEVPVRVYVRVRPLLPKESLTSSEECLKYVSCDQLVLGKDRTFRFDCIFPPSTVQADIYDHCVSPLVSSCLEGYNATVFAYGQTGSGKSYTMGSEGFAVGHGGERGIIPRALEQLFDQTQMLNDVATCVRVSYIEVYKEELRDLLDSSGLSRDLQIREDQQANTVVLGATEEVVSSVDEALGWLEAGNTARVTEATHMNQRSSRSHAIFTFYVEQRWKIQPVPGQSADTEQAEGRREGDSFEQCLSAKFHFVDLAGSERVARTGNKGERFKESIYINSGLLALGNVISALGDPRRRSSHVPYRDSKITRLLKGSLGGNARTAMITCLSPAAANFTENLNSLKYAKRARNIRNRPVVNRDRHAHCLQVMQEEIEALREELVKTRLSSKPTSARTIQTVDSSVMMELCGVEGHIRELEEELRVTNEKCAQYQGHLGLARKHLLALRGVALGGVAGLESQQLQDLEEWLKGVQMTEERAGSVGEEGKSDSGPSKAVVPAVPRERQLLIPSHTSEVIELLRSELERCQLDLETDEELFLEKVEELNELESNYNLLMFEKERVENLWRGARETESQLTSELGELLEKMANLEKELMARDGTIRELRKGLRQAERGVARREGGSVGSSEHTDPSVHPETRPEVAETAHTDPGRGHDVLEVERMELKTGYDSMQSSYCERDPLFCEFVANRSLLKGKVKTSSLEDFTDEAVLQSLSTLTECLNQHNGSQSSLREVWRQLQQSKRADSEPAGLGQTHTVKTHLPAATPIGLDQTHTVKTNLPAAESTGLGQTHTIRTREQNLATGLQLSTGHAPSTVPSSSRAPSSDPNASSMKMQAWSHPCAGPPTPIEQSPREPNFSRSISAGGGEHHLEYVEEPFREGYDAGGLGEHMGLPDAAAEMDILNQSTLASKKQLSAAEEKLSAAQEDFRNLNLKIKLKEELIRELVKNSQASKQLNQNHRAKIQRLEQEASSVQRELKTTLSALQEKERQAKGSSEMKSVIEEHKGKLAATERKLASLQKKQKDTQRMVHLGMKSEKRIEDLESEVQRLRNHQEALKRKFKRQSEKKQSLENNLQKYQQRLKELQTHSEQQTKVIRVKTQEAAAAQRKLRQFSSNRPTTHSDKDPRLEAQKAWLDEEVEKVLQWKGAVEALEKELSERERILSEKEAVVAERDVLEAKRLRSSQAAARDLLHMSLHLDSIEDSIRLKEEELRGAKASDMRATKAEAVQMTKERDALLVQRGKLDQKLQDDALLPEAEEKRLLELNEYIDILEAAIEFKNDTITSKQLDVGHLVQHEERALSELQHNFSQLTPEDTQALLVRYFDKVVQLRMSEGRSQRTQKELERQVVEHTEMMRRLERSLKQAQVDAERRIISQQTAHEQQVQFLMQQLAESEASSGAEREGERVEALEAKVRLLEKDLYYYKKTSRELKRKVQEYQVRGDHRDTVSHDRDSQRANDGRKVENLKSSSSGDLDKPLESIGGANVPRLADSRLQGLAMSQPSQTESKQPLADGQAASMTVGVVRKSKKQLRQLSATDIAERMGQGGTKSANKSPIE